MRSGIDIPSCQFDRNRATISGNQVLCASPEGIFLSSPPQPCTLILPLSFYSRELAPVNTEFGLAELCASRRCEYWPPLCRGGTTIAGRPPAQIRTGAFTHTALTPDGWRRSARRDKDAAHGVEEPTGTREGRDDQRILPVGCDGLILSP